MIGKAVLVVLMLTNSPHDDSPELITSVSLVESLGNSSSVLAACESQGLALMRKYPDIVVDYSCELFIEEKHL